MEKKIVFKAISLLYLISLVVACGNAKEDLYDAEGVEKTAKETYRTNFMKKYPSISLNQSWDFSTQTSEFSLPVSNKAATRADGTVDVFSSTEYEVDLDVVKWMQQTLPNGKDNRSKGKPFYMRVPSNSFCIIPIYQGGASGVSDLHMVVNGVDYLVWKKSEGIYVKTSSYKDWTPVYQISNTEVERNTTKATAVKTPIIAFSDMPAGADMYFYLEITSTTSRVHTVGDKLSSIGGNMLSLSCQRPANIPEDKQVAIVACEDGIRNNVDWDMEDVVFMVVGNPEIPETVELTNGTPIVQKRTVRYLIEDLGATDDFDFNDIVVDVEQSRTTTPIFTNLTKNGKTFQWLTGWEEGPYSQKAIVRHLGGTLPFVLHIGNTEISEITPDLDSNPDTEYSVTGWDPDTHNISVNVEQQSSNGTRTNTVAFPKAGEAPMIIAVSPAVKWMSERRSIPESWFIEQTTKED